MNASRGGRARRSMGSMYTGFDGAEQDPSQFAGDPLSMMFTGDPTQFGGTPNSGLNSF